MDSEATEKLVVSKKRVVDHGEVYTSKREVNAMLDLVKQETERIESRFLEPACGTGNFLTEILERKLLVVEARYAKSQLEYERYAFLAVSSLYGIDILEDNAKECRRRLLAIADERYTARFRRTAKDAFRQALAYVLERNIIRGDALTLKTAGDNPQPIIFSEWSPVRAGLFKRRDFAFRELLPDTNSQAMPHVSDLGEEAFIPTPVKEYPLIHFLRVADAEHR